VPTVKRAVDTAFREERGRVVAALIRTTGDWDLADRGISSPARQGPGWSIRPRFCGPCYHTDGGHKSASTKDLVWPDD